MKKIVLALLLLAAWAALPSTAEARVGLLRARVRALRVVAPLRIVAPVHQVVAVQRVVAVPVVQRVVVNEIVATQHFIAEPVRAYTTLQVVNAGYGGYGSSASLLAGELAALREQQLRSEIQALRQNVTAQPASKCDEQIAVLRAELQALKQSLVK